jgi:hypothetical protein
MRKIILLLASLFFLFSCDIGIGGGKPTLPTWDNRIPEDFLGVIGGEKGISGSGINSTKADAEYNFIKNTLGAKWILRTFYWNDIQTDANTWDWTFYDNFVNEVHGRGFKIFAVLAYGNDNSGVGSSTSYITKANYPLFANYVTEVIARYGEKIAGYSIWNEPNETQRFWSGPPEEIIELSAYAASAARRAINQYNPKGVLVGGVLNSLAVDAWTTGFFSGAMLNMDAVAYHPYMPGAQRAADLFSAYQNLVSKYGYANRIWLTEVGFPTGGQYVSLVDETRMHEEVVKTITLLAARGAARVFWYELFDDNAHVAEDSEDWFGLATFNDSTSAVTKKNGADAYGLCGKYIPGTVYRPDWPARKAGSGIQAYCFQGPEQSALILWADTLATTDTKPVTVTLPGSDRMQHNIGDGTNTAVSSETVTYNVGTTPLFFTWKPAGAAPSISTP